MFSIIVKLTDDDSDIAIVAVFPADAKVQASNRQVHLLIQACKDQSKGWWMKVENLRSRRISGFRRLSSYCWLEAKKP
jgi:hypothetical protein